MKKKPSKNTGEQNTASHNASPSSTPTKVNPSGSRSPSSSPAAPKSPQKSPERPSPKESTHYVELANRLLDQLQHDITETKRRAELSRGKQKLDYALSLIDPRESAYSEKMNILHQLIAKANLSTETSVSLDAKKETVKTSYAEMQALKNGIMGDIAQRKLRQQIQGDTLAEMRANRQHDAQERRAAEAFTTAETCTESNSKLADALFTVLNEKSGNEKIKETVTNLRNGIQVANATLLGSAKITLKDVKTYKSTIQGLIGTAESEFKQHRGTWETARPYLTAIGKVIGVLVVLAYERITKQPVKLFNSEPNQREANLRTFKDSVLSNSTALITQLEEIVKPLLEERAEIQDDASNDAASGEEEHSGPAL